ncbi:MAG TPA: SigB/SigF/SigG family RNA polymerase sigma factor [Solirubrobacteraceae bacterium]|nr:SigB/SigF/SigG family RNA polymerase sigma factor [Solirubrobacteraceae bacterium]
MTTSAMTAPVTRSNDLTHTDSGALFARWQQQQDPRARELLVERFLPLARKLARRYLAANEPIDDLVQVASLGLVKAIDRFDPDRGLAFSTFAVPTILGELRRYFRDSGWSVHVPRAAQENALAVDKAIKALSGGAAPTPAVQTIAEYLEWSIEDVLAALEANAGRHAASLDEPAAPSLGGEATTLLDTFSRIDEGYECVETQLVLADAIRQLPPATRQIIALRFAEDLTQAEIGRRVGASQMQVSRVLRAALQQLREHLR